MSNIPWQVCLTVTVYLCAGAVRGPAAGAGRSAPEGGVEQCTPPLETQPCLGILFNCAGSLASYFPKIDEKYHYAKTNRTAFLFIFYFILFFNSLPLEMETRLFLICFVVLPKMSDLISSFILLHWHGNKGSRRARSCCEPAWASCKGS